MPRTTKKYDFDFTSVSSAIDRISVQGSTVLVNFVGNDKTYEFTWKPANKTLITKLEEIASNPETSSIGKFYNESLKKGDLVQKPVNWSKNFNFNENGKNLELSRKR